MSETITTQEEVKDADFLERETDKDVLLQMDRIKYAYPDISDKACRNWARERIAFRRTLFELTGRVMTDELTGLVNGVYARERLERLLNLSSVDRLTTLQFDVDNFKQINDSKGHEEGDAILLKVGHLLKEELRPSDTPYRDHGDEFGAILPDLDSDQAFLVAERLRKTVEQGLGITISVGVADYDRTRDGYITPDGLLKRADIAAYQNKQTDVSTGEHGNRVTVFKPGMSMPQSVHQRK